MNKRDLDGGTKSGNVAVGGALRLRGNREESASRVRNCANKITLMRAYECQIKSYEQELNKETPL